MHVDSSSYTARGKRYTRHLLRTSYRVGKKVRHRTVASLCGCSNEEIAAIKLALKHKDNLRVLGEIKEPYALSQGKRIGAVWCVSQLMQRLGLCDLLGNHREGRLAQWQVMARLIDQGSRLSSVRLAQSHAGCEVLSISSLDEDDLYANLNWIAEQQETLEEELFKKRYGQTPPQLFLYDVTSTYLEGKNNALGTFGYNRDGKKGKQQIVVGLLTDGEGSPVAVRVFAGNTQDPKTVATQVRTLANRFGVQEVTLVGDRGMLKRPQLDRLPEGFHYITAITKPQMRTLLSSNVLQMDLFDDMVGEVVTEDGPRYVIRRNPKRAFELAQSRTDKEATLNALTAKENQYLVDHPRAKVEKAVSRIENKAKKLKIANWSFVKTEDRTLTLYVDEVARKEAAQLDGCYVIKTDVPIKDASAQTIHDRYLDLAKVEAAFRTMKTSHLEIRPVYVTKESSTHAHVFVVMLAYLVRRVLAQAWAPLNVTVEEGLDELGAICQHELQIKETRCLTIPAPNSRAKSLLDALGIVLPNALPYRSANVATHKKLQSERPS